MKRAGNLIEKIADCDNLYLAYYKASKGKQTKEEVLEYGRNLQVNILSLREQILSGNISVGNYHYFKIYDPKERLICAASFPERVLHHAIMNICHPYFEKTLIYDTYATRIDKGIYKALEKAKRAMNSYQYVAKLDFRKYFDSISHETLRQKLSTKFKDEQLLAIFDKIIDSYEDSPQKGIPIGNLSSQYFANFYLSEFDHFIKEKLKIKIYVRYMDDMLLFSNKYEELKQQLILLHEQAEIIKLTLKPVVLNKTRQGISFLGYKLFPHKILLNHRSKLRFKTKFNTYQKYLEENIWDEKKYQQHITPLLSFVQQAYTKRLRKEIIEGSNRVLRGGSWNNNAKNCRVSNRNNNTPDNRNNNNGFRLLLAHKKLSDDLLMEQMTFLHSNYGIKNEHLFSQINECQPIELSSLHGFEGEKFEMNISSPFPQEKHFINRRFQPTERNETLRDETRRFAQQEIAVGFNLRGNEYRRSRQPLSGGKSKVSVKRADVKQENVNYN
ncbi:MAG: RNA-directed DNA polymerase [Bacteroidales bacterium]|jgi:hypothetical protein|nr:RNA-directed DNA polymerase [Bacteroidales bacterium]